MRPDLAQNLTLNLLMKYTPMNIPRPAQILLSEANALVARITALDDRKANTICLKIVTKSAKMSKKHTEESKNAESRPRKD